MRKRILLSSLIIITAILIIAFIKSEFLGGKVPFMPIDYNDVDDVLISGLTNKTPAEIATTKVFESINGSQIDVEKVIESINEIQDYERVYRFPSHSYPGPIWSINIIFKEKEKSISIEGVSGHVIVISSRNKSFRIDEGIVKHILSENGLHELSPLK